MNAHIKQSRLERWRGLRWSVQNARTLSVVDQFLEEKAILEKSDFEREAGALARAARHEPRVLNEAIQYLLFIA